MAKDIFVVGAALLQDDKVLVSRRNSDRILGDLKRELEEEFDDEITVGPQVTGTYAYEYEFGTVHLTVFYAKMLTHNFDLIAHSKVMWKKPRELGELTWAPADIPAAKTIEKVNLREVKFDD